MRKLLLSLVLLAVSLGMNAQVEDITFEARGTFHQEDTDGNYTSCFQGNFLNLHVKGHISPNLSYRIRQRFNKRVDDQNPFNATDFLWLRWQASQHWSFTFGKHPILLGGYEIDSAPIDVYYYGAFSNNLSQYYAFGASATWTPVPGQDIWFQFIPSPISPVGQNRYSLNLYWNGSITSWYKTIWSVNLVEDIYHRKMNYIILGNKFLLGPLAVDVDAINRASFKQQRYLLSDWSLIGKAILSLGKWNLCTKVGYEVNDAANIDPDGISYDLVLPAGNDYFYYGAGVEFFPLGNEDVRLHIAYFRNNHDHVHNLDMGVTWRFGIYRRNQ